MQHVLVKLENRGICFPRNKVWVSEVKNCVSIFILLLTSLGNLCFPSAVDSDRFLNDSAILLDNLIGSDIIIQQEPPFIVREFFPFLDGRWIGQAVSYGFFRKGQAPWGDFPSREEIVQDLNIILSHWNLIRLYNSDAGSEMVLEIIQEQELPLRVMLGVWLAAETDQQAKLSNHQNVAMAIELANTYPEIVEAITVGNETQVYWSGHRMDRDSLVRYIRIVRESTTQPVTTADDYNFWNTSESMDLTEEIDFIVTHIHPLWNGKTLDNAISWQDSTYRELQRFHPGKLIVLGETGWSTSCDFEKTGPGQQGTLIKGDVGLDAQRQFLLGLDSWVRKTRVTTFLFEAFDESWKGGGSLSDSTEVEKNWGVHYENRQPKESFMDFHKQDQKSQ
jgi:exo-beta-1,3-glucanase (GH17 family)